MNSRFVVPGLAAVWGLFLCWLYYPLMNAYFSNDDWIWIWNVKGIPVSEPWRFFSMQTIWFYRPIQSLQFGLTMHFGGMNHVWYSLQSLVMHLGVCLLFWKLIKGLFGTWIGTCSTMLFSVSCMSPDTLYWASNFNSLHYSLFTLGAAYTFLLFLRRHQRKYYIYTISLAILNCFSKESCVNLGGILFTVWLTYSLKEHWCRPEYVKDSLKDDLLKLQWFKAIKILWPFLFIALAFTGIHRVFFQNIEKFYTLDYQYAGTIGALKNLLFNTNFSLFGLITYPFVFDFLPISHEFLYWILRNVLILPMLLIWFGFQYRKPLVIFCVLFGMILHVPTFVLTRSEESRYFYLSGGSCAILLSSLFYSGLLGIVKPKSIILKNRLLGYISLISLIAIFIFNIVCFQTVLGRGVIQGSFIKQAFKFLQNNGHILPARSFVILDLKPNYFFVEGMGANEMMALATERSDLYAAPIDLKMNANTLSKFQQLPKFRLKIFTMDLQFETIDNISFMFGLPPDNDNVL